MIFSASLVFATAVLRGIRQALMSVWPGGNECPPSCRTLPRCVLALRVHVPRSWHPLGGKPVFSFDGPVDFLWGDPLFPGDVMGNHRGQIPIDIVRNRQGDGVMAHGLALLHFGSSLILMLRIGNREAESKTWAP